jgi:predicted ATPase
MFARVRIRVTPHPALWHSRSVGFRSLSATAAGASQSVLDRYERFISEGKLKRDEKQVALARRLDRLSGLISKYNVDRHVWRAEKERLEQLRREQQELERSRAAQAKLIGDAASRPEPKVIKLVQRHQSSTEGGAQPPSEPVLPAIKVPRGIYVHGNVGTGKTMLMDMFLEGLAVPKQRVHLHNFIQEIHGQIHKQRQIRKRGAHEIIKEMGADLAKNNVVLAFDEFFVTDIADSAILEALLDAMMQDGIVLVATSNVDPNDLHTSFNSFLPRLLAQCKVHNIDSNLDYRESAVESAGGPLRDFHIVSNDPLSIMGNMVRAHENELTKGLNLMCGFNRSIAIPYVWREGTESVACMTFEWLCCSSINNFGPNEYHTICDHFDKVIVADIPEIRIKPGRVGDQSRRFGTFLDIAYDAGIKVVTISKHEDFFVADEDDLPENIDEDPQAVASLRSFMRARSRWRHLSTGRA